MLLISLDFRDSNLMLSDGAWTRNGSMDGAESKRRNGRVLPVCSGIVYTLRPRVFKRDARGANGAEPLAAWRPLGW